MMANWTCPNCQSVKRAPDRARKDDTRTYCLACSEETGRLVRREPLALIAKRVARSERVKAKIAARAKVERAKEAKARAKVKAKERQRQEQLRAHREVDGMNIHGEFDRIARCVRAGSVSMEFRRGTKGHVTGHAWKQPSPKPDSLAAAMGWRNRGHVHLGIPYGASRAEAQMLMLHELAHIMAPDDANHGPKWRLVYLDLTRKAFGIDPGDPGESAWKLDKHIQRAIEARGQKRLPRSAK